MTSENQSGIYKGIGNKRILLLFSLLGICGLIIFAVEHKYVFPSAAINLTVPKSDILKLAEVWKANFGYQKPKPIESITFNCDDEVKTFLEYELGNATANELMQKQVPVFYWDCGFKKESDQEQMRITLSPAGELFYADREFPNDLAIPNIDHEQARAKAFDFVLKQTGWPKADCKLVEDNVDKQIHRNDHDFIWENQKIDYKGAKLRASASFSGNVLSDYYKYLKLPESWERKYETIRSYNNLLQTIATVFYALLHIAAVFIFFQSISTKQIRWRFVLICSGILTAICFLEDLNNIPSTLSMYDPHKSYAAFLSFAIFGMLASIPFAFMGIAIIVGAAERIYRLSFPNHLPWQKWFSASALRSRYVITGLILGYATFGISIGYQICYYALGEKLHFWCPLGIDKYEILTTAQPWFSAFTLGVFASGAEECLYRVIMLGIGQKLLKNFWIANVLQAMAWGFMHSSYPQQPAYARGVELTIEGIFWGWILRRYGLLPCLVSHYLFDVFCDCVPLLSAQVLGLRLSAFIPLVPFLVLAIVGAWWRRKKGEAPEDNFVPDVVVENKTTESSLTEKNAIENQSATNAIIQSGISATERSQKASISKSEIDKPNYIYQPLLNSTRWVLVGIMSVCLIVSLFWKEPHYEIYQDSPPLKTTRQEVIKIAHDYLVKNHFDLKDYISSANCANELANHREEYQYIFEKAGFAKADIIAHEIEYPHLWRVRFCKPACPEEYSVIIDQGGKIIAQGISKDEDAPGAKLTEKQARKITEDYLHNYRSLYEPLVYSDVEVKNRSHRTDYYFQFKSPKYKVADADLIISVDAIGDIPSSVGHHWKIPDEWKWNKAKITMPKALAMIIMGIISLACFIASIWWVVSLFLARIIRWKPALVPGLIFSVSMIAMGLNYIPSSFFAYNTTIPVPIYITMLAVGGLLVIVFTGAAMIFCLTLAVAAIRQLGLTEKASYAFRSLAPWLNRKNEKIQFNFWLDAILIAGAFELFSYIYLLAKLTLSAGYNHMALINPLITLHSAVTGACATISELTMLIVSLYAGIAFLAIFIAIVSKFGIRKEWQIVVFIVVTIAIGSMGAIFTSSDFHWEEIVVSAIFGIIGSLLYWFFLRKAVARNMLSLLLWLFFSQMTVSLKEFIEYGWTIFPVDICVLIAIALLPIFYVIYLKVRSGSESISTTSSAQ